YLCNGTDGGDGSNGSDGFTSLVTVIEEIAGDNCIYGGSKIETGLDLNRNNRLDSDEITETTYICFEIVDGLIHQVNIEPHGDNCENGGIRIDSGFDSNNNGIVESDEIINTSFICEEVERPLLGEITYPENGAFGPNLLDSGRLDYRFGENSMTANLDEDAALRVKIKGEHWGFNLEALAYWHISLWNEIEHSREFTSKETGTLDTKIELVRGVEMEIIVYESNDTIPSWSKSFIVN
ncbi:MAG: hypothetical protein ABFS32_22040, partial [Bacteroidota bacterium]